MATTPDTSLNSDDPGSAGQTPAPAELSSQDILKELLARIHGKDNAVTGSLADAGSVLGSLSSGEKANRLAQGNFTQGYDQTMLNAQTGRNQNESDALKKLAITEYLMGGGFKPGTTAISLNGETRQLPNYGGNPPPVSPTTMAGAGNLQAQLAARLAPGGSYVPQPLASYAQPGATEKAASTVAVATGIGGVLNDILHGSTTQEGDNSQGGSIISDIANKVPWGKIGGAVKGAGGSIISGLTHLFGG